MLGQRRVPLTDFLRVLHVVDQLLGGDGNVGLDPVDLLALLVLLGHDLVPEAILFLVLPAVLGVENLVRFIPRLVDYFK